MRALSVAAACTILAACGAPTVTATATTSSLRQTGIAQAALAHAPSWSDDAVRKLQRRMRAVFAEPTLAQSGIAIVDADAHPLYIQRATHPFAPASTFKLLAAVSALETFGPAHRFATELRSLDAPLDGVVHGDLWLIGSGDPVLSSDDLNRAAAELAHRGVHEIDGALVADASAFRGAEVNPAWEPDDLQYDYAAGTSALSVDGGTVEFHLVPGAVGAPTRIEVRPPSGAVRVRGGVLTSYATTLTIDRAPLQNDFTFGGRIALGAEQSFWRPVANMPIYAGRVLQSMLAAHGIVVRDGVRTGVAPIGGAVLWKHRSAPLSVIERDMLVNSINHDAEQLLRAVGAERGYGTEATGGAVERALVQRSGVTTTGLKIVDGSGLAASDRVAPLTLAGWLARAAQDPIGPTLIRDLPRVGMEGTVRYRHLTTALGRARAKSGHIEDVNTLAGFVQTRTHGRVAFAIMVNDPRADDGPVDAGIDRALDLLAQE